MKRYVQHEPFNIYVFTETHWPHPIHKHSYFEIIYIQSGRGEHFLNGNTFHYAAGDVFLLGPEDYHSFDIKETTSFYYIRFTQLYMKDTSPTGSMRWMNTYEFIVNTPYRASGSLLTDPVEKNILNHLLIVLLHEYNNRQEYDEQVISGLMKAVLGIMARNLVRQPSGSSQASERPKLLEDMILYICQYIHDPDALRLEALAERFHYSPGYLSTLFRNQMGESIQAYILKYKLKLIENRLRFSDCNVAEITHEFGFTDSSHLHKLFKKFYGVAPLAFRKQHRATTIPILGTNSSTKQ